MQASEKDINTFIRWDQNGALSDSSGFCANRETQHSYSKHGLLQMKWDLDSSRDFDGLTVENSRFKNPFLDCSNCILVEPMADGLHHSHVARMAVDTYDDFECHRSLDPIRPGLRRILRLDFLDESGLLGILCRKRQNESKGGKRDETKGAGGHGFDYITKFTSTAPVPLQTAAALTHTD
jgi:hypothetical protein